MIQFFVFVEMRCMYPILFQYSYLALQVNRAVWIQRIQRLLAEGETPRDPAIWYQHQIQQRLAGRLIRRQARQALEEAEGSRRRLAGSVIPTQLVSSRVLRAALDRDATRPDAYRLWLAGTI